MLGAILGAIRSGIRRHGPACVGNANVESPGRSACADTYPYATDWSGVIRDVEAGSSNLPTPTKKPLVTGLREQPGPGVRSFSAVAVLLLNNGFRAVAAFLLLSAFFTSWSRFDVRAVSP